VATLFDAGPLLPRQLARFGHLCLLAACSSTPTPPLIHTAPDRIIPQHVVATTVADAGAQRVRPPTPALHESEALSRDERESALFDRAKALNVCASLLGNNNMHTSVRCPSGMAYDHGPERCIPPSVPLPPLTDPPHEGEVRCGLDRKGDGGSTSFIQTFRKGKWVIVEGCPGGCVPDPRVRPAPSPPHCVEPGDCMFCG
jgi:hypothetical protein